MNIVHLIDYFQPGLGYQETYLAREQLALGHGVTVVTSDRYAPFPNYANTVEPLLGPRMLAPGRGQEDGIPVWRLPVRYESNFRCWLKGLDAALTTLHPDVVHAHNVIKLTTLQGVLLKPSIGYRLLVDDHMHRVNVNQARSGRIFYAAFRMLLAPLYRRRVDALAAITDETAEIMRTVFGLNRPSPRVIELGVDTTLFDHDPVARVQLRRKLGVADDEFLVVYTGKVIPSKAPHWLVEALALAPAQVKVLLVGNAAPEYRQQIEQLTTAHGLSGRVLLQAAVKQAELPAYYSAADAGCWPRETSLAMLEAAACSLPIVVVNQGVEARVANQNGLQYPEGDIAALAQHLTTLCQQRDEAEAMGRRGRQLVEACFSWREINRQFMEAYNGG